MEQFVEWLNSNAGAVQSISTIVLVLVTIYYAWSTRQIATETQDMATATEQVAELTRQQQVAATSPVIVFRLVRYEKRIDIRPTIREFDVEVVNVGVGPALDFQIHVDS